MNKKDLQLTDDNCNDTKQKIEKRKEATKVTKQSQTIEIHTIFWGLLAEIHAVQFDRKFDAFA